MRIPSLGRRGEGWVVLQFVALAGIGIAGATGPPWPQRAQLALRLVGIALIVAGVALGVFAVRALGSSLSPLPYPSVGADLRRDGVYARARHPIYGALLVVGAGWVACTSARATAPWLCLLAVLLAKSAREEAWLTERDEGYATYRAAVRRRFVPFVG
jgi:protein-S-isoprenylcysteine O-methyltransferase Ste14